MNKHIVLAAIVEDIKQLQAKERTEQVLQELKTLHDVYDLVRENNLDGIVELGSSPHNPVLGYGYRYSLAQTAYFRYIKPLLNL